MADLSTMSSQKLAWNSGLCICGYLYGIASRGNQLRSLQWLFAIGAKLGGTRPCDGYLFCEWEYLCQFMVKKKRKRRLMTRSGRDNAFTQNSHPSRKVKALKKKSNKKLAKKSLWLRRAIRNWSTTQADELASTKRDRTKLGTILVVAERQSIRQAQVEVDSLFGSGVSFIVCDCVLLFREKQKTFRFSCVDDLSWLWSFEYSFRRTEAHTTDGIDERSSCVYVFSSTCYVRIDRRVGIGWSRWRIRSDRIYYYQLRGYYCGRECELWTRVSNELMPG